MSEFLALRVKALLHSCTILPNFVLCCRPSWQEKRAETHKKSPNYKTARIPALQRFFEKKNKGNAEQIKRVVLFGESLKSLEKKGKTPPKVRKIGNKKGKEIETKKKQGLEGQGK